MPVLDIIKDIDARTLTITAEFAASVERVWELYANPRQLEKVWGPPTHPATFVDHDITVGARTVYYMTGPEGEKYAGYWQITAVDEPNSFAFDDGFAHDDYSPNTDLPVLHCVYAFEARGEKTLATYTTIYDSAEALQQVLDMGMEEGVRGAMGQIDVFLATGEVPPAPEC